MLALKTRSIFAAFFTQPEGTQIRGSRDPGANWGPAFSRGAVRVEVPGYSKKAGPTAPETDGHHHPPRSNPPPQIPADHVLLDPARRRGDAPPAHALGILAGGVAGQYPGAPRRTALEAVRVHQC